MFISTTQLRVRYGETDKMNVVYHGNYVEYFEVGRVEAIRVLGITYKEMEEAGVIMPVIDWQARFLRPARYDDLLTVKTTLRDLPAGHRITFHQEVYNEEGKLLTSGKVLLYFMTADDMQRTEMPPALRSKLAPYFDGSLT
jgi:acyl-CoA thioester hydrolase